MRSGTRGGGDRVWEVGGAGAVRRRSGGAGAVRSGAGRRVSGGAPAGGAADPRRCAGFPRQESTPTGTAEPQLSPERGERRGVAARQLRVLLTPLAVAARRLPQKRLWGAGGGGAEGRAPAGKRLCPEPPPALPSPRKAAPASPPATPPGRGSDGVWDADSDGSDAGGEAALVSARGGPPGSAGAGGRPAPRGLSRRGSGVRRESSAPRHRTGAGKGGGFAVLKTFYKCVMFIKVKFQSIFPLYIIFSPVSF